MGALDDLPDTPVGTRRSPLDDLPDSFTVKGPPEQQNRLVGTIRAAAQGATFGLADELKAAVQATKRRISGESVDWGKAYEEALAADRARSSEFAETNPVLNIAGNVAGGFVLPGGAAGGARTLAGAAVRGAATGGATGAMGGFGSAEGGATNRAVGAATGAAVGMPLGAAGATVAKVAGAIPGMLPSWVPGSRAKTQGAAILRNQIEAEGVPPAELAKRIAEANRLGVDKVTIADVAGPGGPVRALSEDVIHHPSTAQGPYTSFLRERQAGERTITGYKGGQGAATERDVREAARLFDQRAYGTGKDLLKTRADNAAKLFDAARKVDVAADPRVTAVWKDVIQTDAGKAGLAKTRRLWSNKYPGQRFPLDDLRNQTATPNMAVLQMFKEGLDDATTDAFKEGGEIGKSAKAIRDRFRDTLKDANPTYGKALEQYAGDSALKDALDKGTRFMDPKTSADEVEDIIAGYANSPSELEQYRIAAVTALFKGQKAGPTVDYTRKMLEGDDALRKVMALAPDDETREILLKKLTIRQGMAGTAAGRGNSATSGRQETARMMEAGEGVEDVPTWAGGLAAWLLKRIVNPVKDRATAARRSEVGRLLMYQDTEALKALQNLRTGPTGAERLPGVVAGGIGAAGGQGAGIIATPPDPRRRRNLLGGP